MTANDIRVQYGEGNVRDILVFFRRAYGVWRRDEVRRCVGGNG